jgi:hypothetical protein
VVSPGGFFDKKTGRVAPGSCPPGARRVTMGPWTRQSNAARFAECGRLEIKTRIARNEMAFRIPGDAFEVLRHRPHVAGVFLSGPPVPARRRAGGNARGIWREL